MFQKMRLKILSSQASQEYSLSNCYREANQVVALRPDLFVTLHLIPLSRLHVGQTYRL